MNMPINAAAASWALEAITAAEMAISERPWRLVELDLIDLPWRHALRQNRKASLMGPPTGNSSRGLMER